MKRKRRDENHAQIVRELREAGASVKDTSQLGGFCDIVVGLFGNNYLFEIKTAGSQDKLTRDEAGFHATWKGQVAIIHSADEALSIIFRSLKNEAR